MLEEIFMMEWEFIWPYEFMAGAGVAILIYFMFNLNMLWRIQRWYLIPLLTIVVVGIITFILGWFL